MEPGSLISRGLCRIPLHSNLVSDADEEVFLLYTDLAAKQSNNPAHTSDGFRGLGFLDSHQDILILPFELKPTAGTLHGDTTPSRRNAKKAHARNRNLEDRSFEIQLAQDKTALRTRKGDTGSVVWKASVEFAHFLLQQNVDRKPESLLNPSLLENAHVLELGAGTGLLSIALARLVRQYTVTDMEELMPLIRKNLKLNLPGWEEQSSQRPRGTRTGSNPNVKTEALDWLTLHNCPPTTRQIAFSYDPIDLLLVVDCIYHPSLLPALVHTIDYLTTPERTAVLVVVELRAEDVIREFLELWLDASGKGIWEIWHVNDVMEGPYAAWLGWKKVIVA